MCAQRRFRSAFEQSDQSSLVAFWITKDENFLHADSKGPDAQADLSLRRVHMSKGSFSHVAAQIVNSCDINIISIFSFLLSTVFSL